MNNNDWVKHLLESIYNVWFTLFSSSLPLYNSYAAELIKYSKVLLTNLKKKVIII